MSTDVLGYLNSKSLPLKRATGNEVNTACFFCGEDAQKRGRLYINVDPDAEIVGLYSCKLCDAHGALPTLKRHFGDATEQEEKADDSYLRRAVLAAAASYYHDALTDNGEMLQWLRQKRGLTVKSIVDFQLGFADGGLYRHLRQQEFRIADILATGLVHEDKNTHKLRDFLHGHVTIPYIVSGNVVMIRGRDLAGGDRKYVTPAGQKTRLFNSDVTWDATEVVCCEGEFDAMVCGQLGIPAVAVPGADTWQDTWDGYFKDMKRIYVVFDNDDAGTRGAEKVAKRFGSKARVVAMPEHGVGEPKVDVSEFIVVQGHSAEDFRALLDHAGGGLLLTVADARAEHAELQGQIGLRFGIPKLDLLLEPGLLASQVMIFIAKSGAGKTLLLLNLFQRVCMEQPDAKILFFSLEQTRGDWWERARRIYRFFHVGATDEDAYDFWVNRIRLVDRNRVTPEQFLTCVEDFTDELGKPDLVGVDYLGYWAQSFKGDRYERTSDAVMELKALAKDQRLAVMAPHQVSRMTMAGTEPATDGARDSGVIEETADFVIPIWSPDQQQGRAMDQRTGEFKLKIGKSRHGGTGHKEDLWLAPLSLAIVPEHERAQVTWAINELTYQTSYKERWEDALVRHEAGTHRDIADWAAVERAFHLKRQGRLVEPKTTVQSDRLWGER